MDRLEKDIMRTLLYYEVFSFPLKAGEIMALSPTGKLDHEEFFSALGRLTSGPDAALKKCEEFYCVCPYHHQDQVRLKNQATSRSDWETARRVAGTLRKVPFVRGIFVTGSLSKNSSCPGSDIDFLVVCAPRRVWISRLLIRLIALTAWRRTPQVCCLNYMVSQDTLAFRDQNIYTAMELAWLCPLESSAMLQDIRAGNEWVHDFLPRFDTLETGSTCQDRPDFSGTQQASGQSFIKRVGEFLLAGPGGDFLDSFLLGLTRIRMARKFPDLNLRQTQGSMVLERGTAKFHGTGSSDHKFRIMGTYEQLLQSYGLARTMHCTVSYGRTVPGLVRRLGSRAAS